MTTIVEAIAALRRGEVVGVPTDTVYGLAAEPHREDAVAALYELKGRAGTKAIPILVADVAQAGMVAELEPNVEALALEHWPGALTLVLPRRTVMPGWVGDRRTGTVAVRVPDHAVTRSLLDRSGPLAVTSANVAGEPPALSDVEARDMFGATVGVFMPGLCTGSDSSTVVDMTQSPPVVLRSGPVAWP